MKLDIPLYIESHPKYVIARPLFCDEFDEVAPLLEKVLARAKQRLLQWVEKAKSQARQDTLRELTFSPESRWREIVISLEWKKRTFKLRQLVLEMRSQGQRLGFLPKVLQWFDFDSPSSLESRSGEALLAYLRAQESEGYSPEPEHLGLEAGSKAWVHICRLDVAPAGKWKPPKEESLFAFLDMAEERSGSKELSKVGRCLNQEVEDETSALGREEELGKLRALLGDEPRAAVALLGPRQVGKSNLISALVASQKPRKGGQFWLVEPGRLVAGMSIVGQWESRWVKILNHMRSRNHVLVIDDLLGFLSAGVSRDSSLNAAQLLKSYLERSQVRVIAEMTPEAWYVLRQRDRALAEFFRPLYLEPTPMPLTQRILLKVARQAEGLHSTTFGLDALRAIYEICDRYLTLASFPGKGARLLHQMAARYRNQVVSRAQVLEHFQASSGLSLELLDQAQTLDVCKVEESLGQHLVGQAGAIRACAEVVSLAKARLAWAHKPIASLLFIGPTGVGKSECAKALAAYMFGSSSQLLRFDLNEFVGEDALARLLGTFERPQGLLTEAARRQPFGVLLLDEIEKAHPRVLQLLLQLLGDGRLSDARGRVADFSQMVIVMTSNLGADQERRWVGLRQSGRQNEQIYRRAAERFFTPELFNRLDRVVPFRPLSRTDMLKLAQMRWERLLARDGLVRRQTLLSVDAGLLESLSEIALQRGLGARALKREVERQLTGPVAQRLAELPLEVPTWIRIGADLQVEVAALQPVEAGDSLALHLKDCRPEEVFVPMSQRLDRWEKGLDPPAGQVSSESLQHEQLVYFEKKQALVDLRDLMTTVRANLRQTRPFNPKPPSLCPIGAEVARKILASSDLSAEMEQLYQGLPEERQRQAWGMLSQLMLGELALHRVGAEVDEVCLELEGEVEAVKRLRQIYNRLLPECDLQLNQGKGTWQGTWAERILEGEMGLHLFLEGGKMVPVQVGKGRHRVVRLYHPQWGCLDLAGGWWAPRQKLEATLLLARFWGSD